MRTLKKRRRSRRANPEIRAALADRRLVKAENRRENFSFEADTFHDRKKVAYSFRASSRLDQIISQITEALGFEESEFFRFAIVFTIQRLGKTVKKAIRANEELKRERKEIIKIMKGNEEEGRRRLEEWRLKTLKYLHGRLDDCNPLIDWKDLVMQRVPIPNAEQLIQEHIEVARRNYEEGIEEKKDLQGRLLTDLNYSFPVFKTEAEARKEAWNRKRLSQERGVEISLQMIQQMLQGTNPNVFDDIAEVNTKNADDLRNQKMAALSENANSLRKQKRN